MAIPSFWVLGVWGFGGRRVLAQDLMKSEFCLVKVNQ